MEFTYSLDSTITLTDVLVPDVSYYTDFAGSVCAFVMNIWPGLTYFNGYPIERIRSIGTSFTTCKAPNNIIEFESVAGYGIKSTWSIPKDGYPSVYGYITDHIGYYVFNGQEKVVCYGYFDDYGILKQIPGTLSQPISLMVDNWDWVYENPVLDPITGLPIAMTRKNKFPILTGCRIDALPARNDCATNVIQKYFDFTDISGDLILGDIPIVYDSKGAWYWNTPGTR